MEQRNVDNARLDELITKYSDMVYRLAVLRCHTKEDAEDVYSEVFLNYFRRPREFESEEHRKAWLIKVTINCAKDLLGKRMNFEDIEEVQVADPKSGVSTEELIDLRKALNELKEDYKEVICLFYLDDVPVKDIAVIIGRPENTVKSMLHRGREMLREKLEAADKAVKN